MRFQLLMILAMLLIVCGACVDPPVYQQPVNYFPRLPTSMAATDIPSNVLIFAGTSAWISEVEALKTVLVEHGAGYEEVSSSTLDSMSLDELSRHELLIVPGGISAEMAESVRADTHARLRAAVQDRGVGYLGLCAGAWLAVAPAPVAGQDVIFGFGVVDGPLLQPSPVAKLGREYAMTRVSFPDSSVRELLWYGGPATPEIADGVVARFFDGSPAITQLRSGNGQVIVSGVHLATNQDLINALGLVDSDGVDFDLAWRVLDAAIHGRLLPVY